MQHSYPRVDIIATEVVYGPLFLGGAGFFHLYDDQGYGQVKLFMKFWRSPNNLAGKLLQITMAWHQFSVGTSRPLLEDTSTKLPHLEAKWIASIQSFLNNVDGQLKLGAPFIAPLQHQRDAFIMDVAIQSGKFKPAAMCRLNYCRMHLNVLLLSDIASPCGKEVDPTMYTRVSDDMSSWTDHHGVNQPRPNDKAWKEWNQFLHLVTMSRTSQLLHQPVGKWLVPASQLRRHGLFCTTVCLTHFSIRIFWVSARIGASDTTLTRMLLFLILLSQIL